MGAIIIEQISYLCVWVTKAIQGRPMCPVHQRCDSRGATGACWGWPWCCRAFPLCLSCRNACRISGAVPFQAHSLPQGLAVLSGQRDRHWMEAQLEGWGCISCSRGHVHHFSITFWGKWILNQANHSEALVISPDVPFCYFRYRKKCQKRCEICFQEGWNVGAVSSWSVFNPSVHSTAHCCSHGWAAQGTTARGRELCTLQDSSSKVLWAVTKQIWLLRKSGVGIFPVHLSGAAKRAIKCRHIYCWPSCTGPVRKCSFPAGWLFVSGVEHS